MKTSLRHFVCLCTLILCTFMLSVQSFGQNTATTFYVSSGNGGQVLAVNPNASPATVTVIFPTSTLAFTFAPEDMIVGPDGNLWVCNTTNNQILRLFIDPANPTAPATGFQIVFDNSSINATSPTLPEGCSFASTLVSNGNTITPSSVDLYFNAQAPSHTCHSGNCTGVWKIQGAAKVPTDNSQAFGSPMSVSQAFTSGTTSPSQPGAEGVEFDKFGDLLSVDQTNGKVMRGLPPNAATGVTTFNCGSKNPNCVSSFIPQAGDVNAATLSQPTGVAVNTCHDILVANSGTSTLNRYNGNTGVFEDQLSFSNKDTPRYAECDITNNCYVVTGDEIGNNSSDGKIWLVAPPANNQLFSCALPANTNKTSSSGNTVQLLVDLGHLAAGQLQGNIPLSKIANALGVAVPATSMTIAQTFAAGTTPCLIDGVSGPCLDYNFGHHDLRVQCTSVLQPFTLAVTSVLSRPPEAVNPEISFSTGLMCPSPTGVTTPTSSLTCDHYASQHGFCNQYIERAFAGMNTSGTPITDSQMVGYCGNPMTQTQAFNFWIFNQSDDLLNFPGMAHFGYETAPPPPPNTNPPSISFEAAQQYNACVTHDFYNIAADGTLCRTCVNSKRLYINSNLSACNGTAALKLNSPAASCTTANGCNPQFNIGQNIAVKATITCNGSADTTAVERLSIIRVQHTTGGMVTNEDVPQAVVATKNSATDNFMNVNSNGVYSFNVDSSFFDQLLRGSTAVYQFNIWGNGFTPFTFFTAGTF